MKKIIALLLAFILILPLFACESSNKIVGSWEGSMDMTSYIESMMNTILNMDVEAETVALDMTFTFSKDGFFTCNIDQESAAQVLDALLRTMAKNLPIAGLTEDDVYMMLEEQLNVDDIIGSIVDSFVDCFYVYEDGCIYTGFDKDALEHDPVANSVMTWQVSVKRKTMTILQITQPDGTSLAETIPGILPMEFSKK